MEFLGQQLSVATLMFLLLALGLALSFEFVNGFHDTANAVATVIYTHTLKPNVAVVWSGCWNLIGVLQSTGGVAFGVIALLPVELVINVGSGAGFAMVFALLISAIIWNVGTWYFGLPASSSHTLIGSIMGVGLANSLMAKGHVFGEGVNWAKAAEVGMSLLISPIVGFVCAALLLLLCKALIKRQDLYRAPDKEKAAAHVDSRPADADLHRRQLRARLQRRPEGHGADHADPDRHPAGHLSRWTWEPPRASIQEISPTAADHLLQMDRHSPGVALAGCRLRRMNSRAYLKTTGVATDRTYAAIGNKCREISEMMQGKKSLTRSRRRSSAGRCGATCTWSPNRSGKLVKQHKLTDRGRKKPPLR